MSTDGTTDAPAENQPDSRDDELAELRNHIKSVRQTAKRALSHQQELREELAAKDERIDDLEAEVESLRQEVRTLEDRTGLLEHVQEAAALKPDQRAAVCIQTLYNGAWKRLQSDANVEPTASMDYKKAEGALGGSINRDAIYRTFQRAAELVGDDDLVRYVKEDRGASKNTRLTLDLREGDLPETIAGRTIEPPEEGR